MISSLAGTLRHKSPEEVVVECGGVGYGLVVPMSTYGRLPDVGQPVTLLVHTHVREDALQLFGFGSPSEKTLFLRLLSVSGIGPKMAVVAMAGGSAADLAASIQRGDVKRLTMVPGIGKKTAERIVLELRDKLADIAAPQEAMARRSAPPSRNPVEDDVVSALVNLGYRSADAEAAASEAAKGGEAEFEGALREALRRLAPRS